MKDVLLIETLAGGDIGVSGNTVVNDETLSNIVYLALFGGNVGKSTRLAKKGEFREYYWGNDYTIFGDSKMDSGFEYALQTIPLSSGAKVKLESIAQEDLKCLLKYFKSYSVKISLIYVDYITLDIEMVVEEGQKIEKSFTYKKNDKGDYNPQDYSSADYYTTL